MAKITILVVDDDKTICRALKYQLNKIGYEAISADSGEECIYHLNQDDINLVLLDIRLPGMSGIEALGQIQRINSDLPVIMITAYGSIESAVAAMKAGAYDYITKPVNFEAMTIKIEKALEATNCKKEIARLRAEQEKNYNFSNIKGRSQAIRSVISMSEKIAESDSTTVLIQGESGVGKDLLAKVIHYESPRGDKPFIEINCTALPLTLLTSELFGHEKGAFTDAKTKREGLLELADGGTVFFNEIGNIAAEVQAKLLSVMEYKAFRRIGGKEEINVDVRIIAATNRDLKASVEKGTFREDLYYRLHVLPIFIPPLRERKEDIMSLAHYFLEQFNEEFRKKIEGFSKTTEEYLVNYDWPGNVRELKNVIERAVILSSGEIITPALLPPEISETQEQKPIDAIYRLPKEGIALEEVEKQLIKQALDMTGWRQSNAAQLLRLGRGAMQYRMKKYGFLK
ncbi:MAG: sigma-54-dependent transcriptional regulator [Candidatus Poribacteria bacterium]